VHLKLVHESRKKKEERRKKKEERNGAMGPPGGLQIICLSMDPRKKEESANRVDIAAASFATLHMWPAKAVDRRNYICPAQRA
jgi:hypothetical protein